MTNEIVYTNIELDEVALGGEVFKKAREFSSGGSPIAAPQSQSGGSPIAAPQSQSTTSKLKPNYKLTINGKVSVAYEDMYKILKNLMFDENEKYLTSFSQRDDIFTLISKNTLITPIKANEIFFVLHEQKDKIIARLTFNIAPFLKKQNLNKDQLEETITLLQLWIEELGKKYTLQKLNENKEIISICIDFTKTNQLNESFLRMFGTAIEMIVGRMFGQDVQLPYLTISGSPQQMQALTDTLAKEKRYVDSYVKYGLDDPRTYQDQYKLQNAINNFERETGIKWPIK